MTMFYVNLYLIFGEDVVYFLVVSLDWIRRDSVPTLPHIRPDITLSAGAMAGHGFSKIIKKP